MSGRTWLVPGAIDGVVLRLDEPLSFWGGFDAVAGEIIDRAHPQRGTSLSGRVVVMPGSRGSSGTPGVLGESLRRGTGPSALIINQADINLVTGSLAADALYGVDCPILLLGEAEFDALVDGQELQLNAREDT